MMEQKFFLNKRKEFQRRMSDNSIAIFFSAKPVAISNDVYYRFRQNSDFYYLTGFKEEESILIITKNKTKIYLRKNDPEKEKWMGPHLTPATAKSELDVDIAQDIAKFKKNLYRELKGNDILYYAYGIDQKQDTLIFSALNALSKKSRKKEYGPDTIVQPGKLLNEMRLIKSDSEIDILKECARITGNAHRRIMQEARPGCFEYELDALIQHEFRKEGGREAYPSVVASGARACILHYSANTAQISANDLVLVDAGVEKNFMNADVTRTFPISGKFTKAQRALYEIVLLAQKNGVARLIEGATLDDVHKKTIYDLVCGLIEIGIFKNKSAAEIIKKKEYEKYYLHKTSHWLGFDVHDAGSYYKSGRARKLENGMVCTVEPGLYLPIDDKNVPAPFRGLGIRIEDDVVVNGKSPLNLTGFIPKEIDELEEIIGSR